jgi:hypothetical protein
MLLYVDLLVQRLGIQVYLSFYRISHGQQFLFGCYENWELIDQENNEGQLASIMFYFRLRN